LTDVIAERRALTDRLGVVIDPELLSLALTHRSYAYENGQLPHNERLEFLGEEARERRLDDRAGRGCASHRSGALRPARPRREPDRRA